MVDPVVLQGLAVAVPAALLQMTGEDDETEIEQKEIGIDGGEEGDHAALQRKETAVDDTIMITGTATREKETERGIEKETEER